MSWMGRLKKQWGQIQALFKRSTLDAQTLEELEDLLIAADVGVPMATWLMGQLQEHARKHKDSEIPIQHVLAQHIAERLRPYVGVLPTQPDPRPYVILMVGVNGSGKTTTCAKLAYAMKAGGLNVRMVAGDLFRAAATEQLCLWGQRLHIPVDTGAPGQTDASGLVFQSYTEARARHTDVLIIDTAGRLHHRADLMAELAKIHRVLGKIDPSAPHLTLFVLDGTSGQNGLKQLQTFQETLPIHGLILSKLDGTAKGGLILNLMQTFHMPLYGMGTGERPQDWEAFDPEAFSHALVGL